MDGPAEGAGRTILLVDDDVTLRELLADALEREGYRIFQASNGEEGVAAALTHRPDVVISDIVMPEMNGWELCQALRSLPSTKATPFIFLSSLDQAPEKVLALRLGADEYLTKPFHLSTVLAKVQQLIGRLGHRDRLIGGGETAAGGEKLENMLVDTVEFLRATRRTGVIAVNAGPAKGLIYLEGGVLKHAVLGRSRGEEALVALLRLADSQVTFKEGSYPNLPANVTVAWEDFMTSLLDRGSAGPGRG